MSNEDNKIDIVKKENKEEQQSEYFESYVKKIKKIEQKGIEDINLEEKNLFNQFNKKEKEIIEQAMKIVEAREEEKRSGKVTRKEIVREQVDRTKKIFLMGMKKGLVKKEEKQLKDKKLIGENILKEFEDKMISRNKKFKEDFNKKKKMAEIKIIEINNITNQKNKIIEDLKRNSKNLGKIKTTNNKLAEKIAILEEFRKFLINIEDNSKTKMKSKNSIFENINTSKLTQNFNLLQNLAEEQIPFQRPEDLIHKFSELEKKNLFLIEKNQENEQIYFELQSKFSKIKKEKELHLEELKKHKIELLKKLESNNNQMKNSFFKRLIILKEKIK